jgi:hypothetical protein
MGTFCPFPSIKGEKMNKTDTKGPVEIIVQKPKHKGSYKIPTFEETKKVKGTFKNLEMSGAGISFPFRGNWKGPVRQFTFFDGCEYEIPEEVAIHLNGSNAWYSCTYKSTKWVAADGTETVNAKPVVSPSMPNFKKEIGKKTSRFLFQVTG